jgi:hypothetical protein
MTNSTAEKLRVVLTIRKDVWESGDPIVSRDSDRLGEEELSRRGKIVGPIARDVVSDDEEPWSHLAALVGDAVAADYVMVRYTAQVIPNES